MPTTTPLIKVNRTKSYGAEVVLSGDVYNEAYDCACRLAEEHGYTMIHPFNDLDVADRTGSIAMEIIKELPTVDYILCPVGGGGLCTGVSTLAKLLNPKIRVISMSTGGSQLYAGLPGSGACGHSSFSGHHRRRHSSGNGDKLLPYIQSNVDEIITVEDKDLIISVWT